MICYKCGESVGKEDFAQHVMQTFLFFKGLLEFRMNITMTVFGRLMCAIFQVPLSA